ncbi:hypothetical protein P389DRAFT_207425 [Cystobasidium minutum MCA 4210]|uniref:uncharacterized protein n=1 Tax=Cystobasidium minutum MCA 4210 TaxID=1397322 RepID=UPI0034CD431B|eukprot:jgi/Rhomi1/207425/estExt_Genemark1.C_1_t10322
MSGDEEQFPARRILDEDTKKRRYKVDWEGVNPDTGRAWSPTWEPYEFVSEALINEFKLKQRRRAASGLEKASRAALRDFDIKRNKSHTPSEEEYVSPPGEPEQEEESFPVRRVGQRSKQSIAKPRRKSEASGSGSSYKPSNQSTRSTELSTELSTIISSGSLRALQSQKASTSRRQSEPSLSTKHLSEKAQGKRRRQEDESMASTERSRPLPKKSKQQSQRDELECSPDQEGEESEDSEEEDAPVVLSRRKLTSGTGRPASMRPDSPERPKQRLSAIPESLRLKTASTSVSRTTHGTSDALAEGLFADCSILDQNGAQPPSARRVDPSHKDAAKRNGSTSAARHERAAQAGKTKKVSQPLSRKRSDEGTTRSVAEASLPSFKKKANGIAPAADASYSEHQRRPSASASASTSAWPLLDTASKEPPNYDMDEDSPSVIPDSAPQTALALSPVHSPPLDSTGRIVEGLSVRQSWRNSHPPGSRLAYANIEKPRMPVKVPEPEVFKSFLDSTQATEDIQQFSSQASPPDQSSSEEILKELTTSSKPVAERAFPSRHTGSQGLPPAPDATFNNFETAPEADYTMDPIPDSLLSANLLDDALTSAVVPDVSMTVAETMAAETGQGELPAVPPNITDQAPQDGMTQEQVCKDESGAVAPSTAADGNGTRVLGPAEVTETIEAEREVRSRVRQSTLLTNESIRQDLLIYVDSPAYYIHTKRSLTKQPTWDFELEATSDENEQVAWHLVLDMEKGEYKVEKRVRKFVTVTGDSGDDQVMSLYTDLLAAHAALKKTNDAATLRIGELETDIQFMREQDRAKGKQIDELALEKQRLEDDIRLLRQQVTLGVKQVELIWSAKEQKMRQELDKAQKQLEITKTMIRTSNIEELRGKAAQVEELQARERNRIAAEQAEKQRQAMRRSDVYSQFINSTFSRTAETPAGDGAAAGQAVSTTAEAESEEDGDFVGGSSDDSDGESSSSYESSVDVPQATAPLAVPTDLSEVQYPALPASELVNAALGSAEGILPGGLASISPAPTTYAADTHMTHIEDMSGETTEVTTSVSIAAPFAASQEGKGGDTQQSSSSGAQLESEEILELDSAVLESQLAYPCRWRKASGTECRALFQSQKELYDHVVDEHAT